MAMGDSTSFKPYAVFLLTQMDIGGTSRLTIIGLSHGVGLIRLSPGLGRGSISWGYLQSGQSSASADVVRSGERAQARYAPFKTGDTVGCGVNAQGGIYFTKNGEFQGR